MKLRFKLSLFSTSTATLVFAVGLYFFLNLTSPLTSGPWGVLAVFILIYGVSLGIILTLFGLVEKVYSYAASDPEKPAKQNIFLRWRKRSYFMSIALALIPIFIVSLNSIGSLEIRDMVLIFIIEALLIFYIIHRY